MDRTALRPVQDVTYTSRPHFQPNHRASLSASTSALPSLESNGASNNWKRVTIFAGSGIGTTYADNPAGNRKGSDPRRLAAPKQTETQPSASSSPREKWAAARMSAALPPRFSGAPDNSAERIRRLNSTSNALQRSAPETAATNTAPSFAQPGMLMSGSMIDPRRVSNSRSGPPRPSIQLKDDENPFVESKQHQKQSPRTQEPSPSNARVPPLNFQGSNTTQTTTSTPVESQQPTPSQWEKRTPPTQTTAPRLARGGVASSRMGGIREKPSIGDDPTQGPARMESPLHALCKRPNTDIKDLEAEMKRMRLSASGGVKCRGRGMGIFDVRDDRGQTPLFAAAGAKHLAAVKLLLPESNVNCADHNGWTPLHVACYQGDAETVYYMLTTSPADANARSLDLSTPLHYFSRHPPPPPNDVSGSEYYFKVLPLLLGKEGKVYGTISNNSSAANKAGDTPLHYAAATGSPELVEWLLRHHAHVNQINQNREAAMHIAVRAGSLSVVEKLSEFGASIDLVGNHGTPKDIAIQMQNASIKSLFMLDEDNSKPLTQSQLLSPRNRKSLFPMQALQKDSA